jgi:hypothetical protein
MANVINAASIGATVSETPVGSGLFTATKGGLSTTCTSEQGALRVLLRMEIEAKKGAPAPVAPAVTPAKVAATAAPPVATAPAEIPGLRAMVVGFLGREPSDQEWALAQLSGALQEPPNMITTKAGKKMIVPTPRISFKNGQRIRCLPLVEQNGEFAAWSAARGLPNFFGVAPTKEQVDAAKKFLGKGAVQAPPLPVAPVVAAAPVAAVPVQAAPVDQAAMIAAIVAQVMAAMNAAK